MEGYLTWLTEWGIGLVVVGFIVVLVCSCIRWIWEEVTLGKWERDHKDAIPRSLREE